MNGEIIRVWVVYEHPTDFPNDFVVRGQSVMVDGAILPDAVAWKAASLEEARALLHAAVPGLTWLPRHPKDDPNIVECWI